MESQPTPEDHVLYETELEQNEEEESSQPEPNILDIF